MNKVARGEIEKTAIDLRNIILGANDGVVTTFAIIASSEGANLPSKVIVVLGLSKVIADAVSMAAGVYMGVRSEAQYEKNEGNYHWRLDRPIRGGLLTFFAFVIVGLLVLSPYVFALGNSFLASSLILAFILFSIGSKRKVDGKWAWFFGGVEALFIGGMAAFIAYWIGGFVEKFII